MSRVLSALGNDKRVTALVNGESLHWRVKRGVREHGVSGSVRDHGVNGSVREHE